MAEPETQAEGPQAPESAPEAPAAAPERSAGPGTGGGEPRRGRGGRGGGGGRGGERGGRGDRGGRRGRGRREAQSEVVGEGVDINPGAQGAKGGPRFPLHPPVPGGGGNGRVRLAPREGNRGAAG